MRISLFCATITVALSTIAAEALGQSGDPFKGIPANEQTSSVGVDGYTDKLSVRPGDTLTFMTSTSAASFSATIIRVGRVVDTSMILAGIAGTEQVVPDSAWKHGCGWQPTFRIVIPDSVRSGMYSALLKDENNTTAYVTFIVKPGRRAEIPLAVVASTNTWNAYNAWGGKSLYYPSTDYAQFVSFRRPNPRGAPIFTGQEHLASAENLILSWLERNGYSYDLFTDMDLHTDSTLLGPYRTVILNTHPEYYTNQMIDCLDRFLAKGGNLLYLGGNGVYWKVTYDSTNTTMECRKDGSVHSQTGERGGLWRNLGSPEAAILGVRYTSVGYNTFAPYRVLAGTHWTFQGTGLETDALFGLDGVNGGAGSGWETDKIDPMATPRQTVVLARGTSLNKGGADMTYYDHPGGGFVFSAGSLSYGGALVRNPYMGFMLKNLLRGRPTTVSVSAAMEAISFRLQQNYPNPFNAMTMLSFSLPHFQHVTLKVYDVLGRDLTTLLDEEKPAGTHKVMFDGSRLDSGVYIISLLAGEARQSHATLLVR